ncbi:Proteasome activator pa28 beta subunit-containing protein [Spironucleus salmonicida]|uniref:Proteasome activator pa28 beta subunit-containing protein n=1 Tax=Spironucleus salmonicida TaxID=348837 RepID=V6LJC8_9EUKA|nr:Proteasome activator pa28 beta subunit-containing protein [Spironucleus salmonicida]|eukprot:EST44680.1 Proteasome activator pa28 beta subunit-containing protein [Spironucleus salmonicida]
MQIPEALDFPTGSIRSSSEAKQLAKTIKNSMLPAKNLAFTAIYEHLPHLIQQIETELKSPIYAYSTQNDYYNKMMLLCSDFPSTNSLSILRMPSAQNMLIYKTAENFSNAFRKILDSILFWFQVLLPKQTSSGADHKQDVLISLTGECQKAYDRSNAVFEQITGYHNERAKVIKQLNQHQNRDFMTALILLDFKHIGLARAFINELVLNSLTLYVGINGNWDTVQSNSVKSVNEVIY